MSSTMTDATDGLSRPASMRQLFTFASIRDKLLMIVGLTCAVIYGLRLLVMAVMFSQLFLRLSHFDVTLTYSKLLLEHNETDRLSHNLADIFGTTSLRLIFTEAFDEFGLQFSIQMVVLWFAYYGMVVTLDVAARRQTTRAISGYLRSLMRQDMAWFDGNQTGKLVSQTSDDFEKFEDAIGLKLGLFFACVSGYGLNLVYCSTLDWKLTFAMMAFTPLFMITFKILDISRTVYSKRESNEYAKAGSIAEEVLSAIRTVVAFGAETIEVRRYADQLRDDTKAGMSKAMFATLAMTMFYVTYCGSYAFAAYFGYHLIANHNQAGSADDAVFSMMTVILSSTLSIFKLRETFGHIDTMSHAKSSFGRILSLINRESTIGSMEDHGFELHRKIAVISFKNVSFRYPSRPESKILDDFHLEVKSGETVAIVGESGSGKSTLINLLLRFYDADEGSVSLNGTDVRVLSPHWLRKQIGLVGQEPVLFPTTIAENISYGKPNATQSEIETAARLANAHDFIRELPQKYETPVGDRGAQLSGGQKQRIAIARALIRNPQILLLDEATSALDSQNEAVVQDALEKASRGRTTIVIAHRLSTIRNADRIVVVSFGKIVESGSHAKLMDLGGMYSSFATKQAMDIKASLETCGGHDASSEILPADKVRHPSIKPQQLKNSVDNEEVTSKSSVSAFGHLFRLGYWNSAILICGMIGSIGFGTTFVVFSLERFRSIFAIFAGRNERESEDAVLTYSVFLGCSAIAFVISVILQLGFLGIASARIGRSLRDRAFSALVTKDISFFDNPKNAVGRLCLMLSLDVNNVKQGVALHLGVMMCALSEALIAAAIMFGFSVKFGLIQSGLFFCSLFGTFVYQLMLRKKRERKAEILRTSNECLRQIVTNIRTVVALGLETQFHDKLIASHRDKTISKRREYLMHMFGAVLEGSSQIGCILISLASLSMLLENEIHLTVVFQSLGIAVITNDAAYAIAVIPNFVAALTSLQKIFDVIDSRPKNVDRVQPSPMVFQENSDLIHFKDVTFSYPSRKDAVTLKGFNLSVKAGQTVALVGGSGSGKSTCIQLLERFYEPGIGSINVGDNRIASLDAVVLRRELAVVLQEPALFDRSVAENIAYGDITRTVTMDEIVEAAVVANAHEFICELPQGYQTKVGERGLQISGGQKQRIAIARALVRKAKIVLLDEATSALDTDTEKKVQQSLKVHQRDTTFVIVAHRLSTIVDADVIAVVDKGRIVETGSHAELMAKREHYFRLQCQQTVDAADAA